MHLLGASKAKPANGPYIYAHVLCPITVVTQTHCTHGRNGIFLPSRMGGSPGSIWGQNGVKQVQLGVSVRRAQNVGFAW